MKKVIISLVFLIICSGCWNKVELNDYAIVTGIAIDYKEDEYEVSVLISNSTKGSSDGSNSEIQTAIYSDKGKSMYDAIKQIGLSSSKELYIEHVSILIVSEDVAKEGLNNIFDFFLREPTSKNQFLVTIAKDSSAKDILSILSPLNDFESQSLFENINSAEYLQGEVSKTTFTDLLSEIANDGINPTLNGTEVVGSAEEGSKKDSLENAVVDNYTKLSNTAIFKNDKLVTWADTEESIGINLIKGKITETFDQIDFDDGYIVVGTESYESEIQIKLKDNKPEVTINAKGKAVIHEVNSDSIDLSDEETTKKIQKEFEKKLKENMKKAIKLAKEYKTDIFGIGNLFYKNHPNYFKKNKNNWDDEIFPNIEFKININIDLESKGSAENTLERIEDER